MKKWLLILAAAVITLSCILCACGDDKKDAKSEPESKNAAEVTSASDETTVVLETTSEGDTVEKDSDGNKITRDKTGDIVAVEDKNGNPVEVTEYLTTHSWVERKENSQADSDKSESGQKDNGEKKPSDVQKEDVEGEIPAIIASVPDDDEMIELPDQ